MAQNIFNLTVSTFMYKRKNFPNNNKLLSTKSKFLFSTKTPNCLYWRDSRIRTQKSRLPSTNGTQHPPANSTRGRHDWQLERPMAEASNPARKQRDVKHAATKETCKSKHRDTWRVWENCVRYIQIYIFLVHMNICSCKYY